MVEVCADEMQPLLDPRPDPAARSRGDHGLRPARSSRTPTRSATTAGKVLFVPTSAGPHGLIVNTDEVDPSQIDSYADLFDPQYAGRAAMESTPLTAIGVDGAGARHGRPDGPDARTRSTRSKEYLLDHRDQFRDFAESDASMVNDFKSGETVIADGGRGTTETMIKDGVPAQWIAPKEGVLSWVCGLAITSNAENLASRLQADQLLRVRRPRRRSIGEDGFVVMNPKALPLIAPEYRETADPKTLNTAIPETQPSAEELYDRAWQEVAAG